MKRQHNSGRHDRERGHFQRTLKHAELAGHFEPRGLGQQLRNTLEGNFKVTLSIDGDRMTVSGGQSDKVNDALACLEWLSEKENISSIKQRTIRKFKKKRPEKGKRPEETPPQAPAIIQNRTQHHPPRSGHTNGQTSSATASFSQGVVGKLNHKFAPKTETQEELAAAIKNSDTPVVLVEGPAGTSKTFTPIMCGIDELNAGTKQRLVLCVAPVHGADRIGILPGDLAAKIGPVLRPLYDQMNEILGNGNIAIGFEKTKALIAKGVVEIIPSDFLRGRTFNDTLIICDETQNFAEEEFKTALTRIGARNTTIVMSGDPTQCDLRNKQGFKDPSLSGLLPTIERMEGNRYTKVMHLTAADQQRHPVVNDVIELFADVDGAFNDAAQDRPTLEDRITTAVTAASEVMAEQLISLWKRQEESLEATTKSVQTVFEALAASLTEAAPGTKTEKSGKKTKKAEGKQEKEKQRMKEHIEGKKNRQSGNVIDITRKRGKHRRTGGKRRTSHYRAPGTGGHRPGARQ